MRQQHDDVDKRRADGHGQDHLLEHFLDIGENAAGLALHAGRQTHLRHNPVDLGANSARILSGNDAGDGDGSATIHAGYWDGGGAEGPGRGHIDGIGANVDNAVHGAEGADEGIRGLREEIVVLANQAYLSLACRRAATRRLCDIQGAVRPRKVRA